MIRSLNKASPIDRSFAISGPTSNNRKRSPLTGTRHTTSSLFCCPSIPRTIAAEMAKSPTSRWGLSTHLMMMSPEAMRRLVSMIGVGNMTDIRVTTLRTRVFTMSHWMCRAREMSPDFWDKGVRFPIVLIHWGYKSPAVSFPIFIDQSKGIKERICLKKFKSHFNTHGSCSPLNVAQHVFTCRLGVQYPTKPDSSLPKCKKVCSR